MNAHEHFEDLLPLFVADQLDRLERTEMEKHLATCADCQANLTFWKAVSAEIQETSQSASPPENVVETALAKLQDQPQKPNLVLRAWNLLRTQSSLIQREMWPTSAAVMALGLIVALLSEHVEAIYFLAPLVAAASLSILFSPEYDPAYELMLASPTSPWKVLLARLSIVSGYNLLLTLLATLALLPIVPAGLLGALILGWLAPMTFLSTLALLLSLWAGTGNAIVVTYLLWVAQYMPYQSIGAWMLSPRWTSVILSYQQFWHNPAILFSLSILLIGMALWSANHPNGKLVQEIG